jgi:hypothetical protein
MPVPLPAPRVPPGFPPRAVPAPFAPWIITASSPTGWQGSPPYTEPGDQTAPYIEIGGPTATYTEVGGLTAPSGGSTTWGPSAAPVALLGVGPPPRAWPTSSIAYTHRP